MKNFIVVSTLRSHHNATTESRLPCKDLWGHFMKRTLLTHSQNKFDDKNKLYSTRSIQHYFNILQNYWTNSNSERAFCKIIRIVFKSNIYPNKKGLISPKSLKSL